MTGFKKVINLKRDVRHLGQVFTPLNIVQEMLALRQNQGEVLEPSSGNGAFLQHLKKAQGIELDQSLKTQPHVWAGDFFAYPLTHQFDTIIGNPPYVRYQDILPDTKKLLNTKWFDHRTNLYLFFIEKSLRHLRKNGELIFITPRDFLKATCAKRLNQALYEGGSITYYRELGDLPVFKGYAPNCAVWRWEKGCFNRRLSDGQSFFNYGNGQIWFGKSCPPNHHQLKDWFEVKVGAVSGADPVFTDKKQGNADMVCSYTSKTGETRRMIYNQKHKVLEPHKNRLLSRRIRTFDESNWWEWGRKHCERPGPRLYVNCKTRNPRPFFTHQSTHYDGSVLALFPKNPNMDVQKSVEKLNSINWHELGFACGGRLIFSQNSLSHAPLLKEL